MQTWQYQGRDKVSHLSELMNKWSLHASSSGHPPHPSDENNRLIVSQCVMM